ncbi:unnamed protein product [Sphenostylis stenocarpa]|uniref:Transmembrane protein n=1 Tax=Sphenostylis stenocarpa TaxID=92480 RepID=A0AA86VWE2_9FABA|nr:unnamed protein product [Sphenostylis stenocarpa]
MQEVQSIIPGVRCSFLKRWMSALVSLLCHLFKHKSSCYLSHLLLVLFLVIQQLCVVYAIAIAIHSSSKMQRNLMNLPVLLIIFLSFSYLLSASAVTRTQNFQGKEDEFSAITSLTGVSVPYLSKMNRALGNGEEVVVDTKEGELIERRVYLETQDYEGTGANKDHDPKSPGGRDTERQDLSTLLGMCVTHRGHLE